MRKHMGKPLRDFAGLIGVDESHLSRVENGKTKSLGAPTDKPVRAIALADRDATAVKDLLLDGPRKPTTRTAVYF